MLNGCDISYAQEVGVDISPYDFVIVRSNDGTDKDSKMEAHAQNVLKANKLLGFYLYSYPNLNTAKAEANAMIEYVTPYLGKCILCLDWEGTAVSGNYPESYILEFMETIENNTGITPFFYSFASALDKYPNVAKKYPLWVAHWGVPEPDLGPWSKWTLWQYQGDPFDKDYFDGTKQDWMDWANAVSAEWISKNAYLTMAEMENNAQLFSRYFLSNGWTLEAIAGALGNIQKESTINPGIWGNLDPWGDPSEKGYGLVQWTPYTRITDWMEKRGYPIDSGDGQCAKLLEEQQHPELENTWHPTNKYPLSFNEFVKSTSSPEYLAQAFLYNYERPASLDQPDRSEFARNWYKYLGGWEFVPRLNSDGMEGHPYWYRDNPFWQSGYGLPNCTCYVWGRWWEITGVRPDKLSLGNGDTFYPRGVAAGIPHGQTPQLGAIICFEYEEPYKDEGGHVAVVEKINPDGSIVTSNSAWGGSYFYTVTLTPPDYLEGISYPHFVQGFLYLDSTPRPPGPDPEPPPWIPKSSKWIYYLKPWQNYYKRGVHFVNKKRR